MLNPTPKCDVLKRFHVFKFFCLLVRISNKILNAFAQVDEFDVDKAIWLMRVSTQKSATDPRTGQIDMDALSTGTTVIAGGD